jgi:HD superfamily phosphodiesterase
VELKNLVTKISENKGFENLIQDTFKDEPWVKVFLTDSHHGLKHGDQVRLSALKLLDKLSVIEKQTLISEMKAIGDWDQVDSAVLIVSIAAIFHDCGRFNDRGEAIASEQGAHHIVSAMRTKIFCKQQNLMLLYPAVEEAVLCHDFQSKQLTPELNSPSTITGKIVQSADQMGWFHPDSINRTLAFNKSFGRPFFDPEVSLEERLSWKPNMVARDAFTVMLNQIFGPTGKDRFGIEYAQEKIKKYKVELNQNILKLAIEAGVEKQVKLLILQFGKRRETLKY